MMYARNVVLTPDAGAKDALTRILLVTQLNVTDPTLSDRQTFLSCFQNDQQQLP